MLNPDFKEFIQLLNDHDVRYLVVGGYAVALHGHPRYTKGMDIWLWLEASNAAKAVRMLDDFGFASLGPSEADFLEPQQVIQLGYPPSRIDLTTSLTGMNFETCYPKRLDVEVDGVRLSVIDVESLKQNRRATGRLQDLADVEALGWIKSVVIQSLRKASSACTSNLSLSLKVTP